jgi:outer membrane protein assembly factor BamB
MARTFTRILASAALVLLFSGPIGDGAYADDSVAYQINPEHDGRVVFKGSFAPPLRKKWSRDLGGIVSYPVIANGMVFVTVGNPLEDGTRLFALDLDTGATVWQKLIGTSYRWWSNATYADGKVIVVNQTGLVQAFVADRVGRLAWISQLPTYNITASPTADGGQVFISAQHTLYSLDTVTGNVQWTAATPDGDNSSPAVHRNGVYLSNSCQHFRFDRASGANVWTDYGCLSHLGTTPVYHQGKVYLRNSFSSYPGSVVQARTGVPLHTFHTTSPPAFWRSLTGRLFELTVYNQALYSADAETGQIAWTFVGDHALNTAPIVVNHFVVVGGGYGKLYVVNADTGREVWSAEVAQFRASGESDDIVPGPWSGLGASNNVIVAPATNVIAAFVAD